MKKIIVFLFASIFGGFVFGEPPSAGWNFGNVTYGQEGGSLVLNSLSDRYGISTFQTPTQSLGTNDYIEENAVKNQLAINGYTQAYDYNPQSQTGYGYSAVYNQPLPNVPLTKLTFMGLDGDPTKAQDVYVLTSEYNRLSDQGQAASIDSLNAQTNTNALAINNEAIRAQGAEANLASGLSAETNRASNREGDLQRQINNDERVKVMPEADVRIIDTKHMQVAVYDSYDATNGRNFAFGMRYTLKLGKSYEEKKIDEQARRIMDLEILVNRLMGAK